MADASATDHRVMPQRLRYNRNHYDDNFENYQPP